MHLETSTGTSARFSLGDTEQKIFESGRCYGEIPALYDPQRVKDEAGDRPRRLLDVLCRIREIRSINVESRGFTVQFNSVAAQAQLDRIGREAAEALKVSWQPGAISVG